MMCSGWVRRRPVNSLGGGAGRAGEFEQTRPDGGRRLRRLAVKFRIGGGSGSGGGRLGIHRRSLARGAGRWGFFARVDVRPQIVARNASRGFDFEDVLRRKRSLPLHPHAHRLSGVAEVGSQRRLRSASADRFQQRVVR